MIEYALSLSKGRAVFQLPDELNSDDVQDLRDVVALMMRQIERREAEHVRDSKKI